MVTITVDPASVGGTCLLQPAICSGSTPASLTLNGQTGNVLKWQRSTVSDFSSSVTDIANTSTTLSGATIGVLTTTTYFRAVVQSGVCAAANSSIVTITVDPATIGGTVSSSQTICSGSTPANLTLSGQTGSVVKWQRSTVSNFSSSVTDIANTSTNTYRCVDWALTSTTYFRAVVQSGVCAAANSSIVTIAVDPVSVGGTVSSNQTICSGNPPLDLMLSGQTGNIVKWQRSTVSDFPSLVTDITNNTTTLTGGTIGILTTTTYFRAVVQSGVCAEANSSSVTITVNPVSVGGTVSSDQTICSGSTPASLTLSGQTGGVVKWQRSTVSDFSSSVTDIANTTTTLTGAAIGALTTTTYFRAVVQSGVCGAANSFSAAITVNPTSDGGTVSSDQTICTGNAPADLILSGQTERSLNGKNQLSAIFLRLPIFQILQQHLLAPPSRIDNDDLFQSGCAKWYLCRN
jgi:hypothetical protein